MIGMLRKLRARVIRSRDFFNIGTRVVNQNKYFKYLI